MAPPCSRWSVAHVWLSPTRACLTSFKGIFATVVDKDQMQAPDSLLFGVENPPGTCFIDRSGSPNRFFPPFQPVKNTHKNDIAKKKLEETLDGATTPQPG